MRRLGLSLFALGVVVACGRNWDEYDPRLAATAATSSAASTMASGGQGGTGGSGGSASGGGGGSASGGGGSGGGEVLCGGVGVVRDDFDDGQPNPLFWTAGSSSLQDGQLRLAVPAASDYGNYGTFAAYNLTDRALSLELVDIPDDAGFFFSVDTVGGMYLEFYVDGGILHFVRFDSDHTTLGSMPMGDDTRFVRFVASGEEVQYQVSATGADWDTVAATDVSDFAIDLLHVNVGYYDESPSMAERVIVVDNLEGDAEKHCLLSTLQDDFRSLTIQRPWEIGWMDQGCVIDQVDGQLRVQVAAAMDYKSCTYMTQNAFDASQGSVTVELVSGAASGEGGLAWFILGGADDTAGVAINPDDGTLNLAVVIDGTSQVVQSLEYEPDVMRWLRIAVVDDVAVFEVSADGSQYMEVGAAELLFDPTAAVVYVGGGAYSTGLLQEHNVYLDNVQGGSVSP